MLPSAIKLIYALVGTLAVDSRMPLLLGDFRGIPLKRFREIELIHFEIPIALLWGETAHTASCAKDTSSVCRP